MKIAVLGLGAMGSRMALNLLRAGHEVMVWNRSPSATQPLIREGARAGGTAGEAASDAEVVLACVRDDQASREVWTAPQTGALVGLRDDALAIESSTLSVDWASELAGVLETRAIDFIEAPVLGSRPQAEAASLIHLVGGELAAFDRAQPVLAALGAASHHMGPAGCGAAMKLTVNALLGLQVAALAELLPLTQSRGVPSDRIVGVLAQTAVCSPAAKLAAESMSARTFAPQFPVELVEKDLAYLVAQTGGETAPLSACGLAVFRRAVERGLGGLNLTSIVDLYAPQDAAAAPTQRARA